MFNYTRSLNKPVLTLSEYNQNNIITYINVNSSTVGNAV